MMHEEIDNAPAKDRASWVLQERRKLHTRTQKAEAAYKAELEAISEAHAMVVAKCPHPENDIRCSYGYELPCVWRCSLCDGEVSRSK